MADFCVKFVYMWVSGARGAETVSFDDESLDDFIEVGCHVRDVTLGDVVFCGGVQDFLELRLTHAARGRLLYESEIFLRCTSVRAPFRLSKVSEGTIGRF